MGLMGCLGCDGTYEIGLPQCPHCGTRSPMYSTSEESGMPTITSGGASNTGEELEAEAAQAVEVAEAAPEPEVEQAPDAGAEPAEEQASGEPEAPAAEPEATKMWVGEPGPEFTNLPAGWTAAAQNAPGEAVPAEAEPTTAPEETEAEPQP